MKYAVVKTGGKQYQVREGQSLKIELLGHSGDTVVFDQVLLVVDGDKVELGTPTVFGMKVYAEVLGEVKAEKIEVFKYKSKSRYRKHTGHRQKLLNVKITGIGVDKKSASVKSEPKVKSVKAKTIKPETAGKKTSVKKSGK